MPVALLLYAVEVTVEMGFLVGIVNPWKLDAN